MFDTSKALKTGRSFAGKALAFARETSVVKDFEADVKRALTPAAAAPAKTASKTESKTANDMPRTVKHGRSVVEIYDSMADGPAPVSNDITIDVRRFGISLQVAGSEDSVLMHVINGEMYFAKRDAHGRVGPAMRFTNEVLTPAEDALKRGVMPTVNIAGTASKLEPTQPEFNVTPTKVAILKSLATDGRGRLSAFHIPTVGICMAHGWIRSLTPKAAKKADMEWEITDAGSNALAWHELQEKG